MNVKNPENRINEIIVVVEIYAAFLRLRHEQGIWLSINIYRIWHICFPVVIFCISLSNLLLIPIYKDSFYMQIILNYLIQKLKWI